MADETTSDSGKRRHHSSVSSTSSSKLLTKSTKSKHKAQELPHAAESGSLQDSVRAPLEETVMSMRDGGPRKAEQLPPSKSTTQQDSAAAPLKEASLPMSEHNSTSSACSFPGETVDKQDAHLPRTEAEDGVTLLLEWVQNKPVMLLCETPGCVRHAQELNTAMNTSTGPCDDFYKFVCGSWKPKRSEPSMIARTFDESADIAVSEMENPEDAVLPIAAQYYHSCVDERIETDSEIKIFKSFMADLGLAWPDRPGNGSLDPLEVLLNLSINWNFHMFFNLRAMPRYRGRRQTLYIRRGMLSNWPDTNLVVEGFKELVERHIEQLNVGPTAINYHELFDVVRDIIAAALSIPIGATEDVLFRLKDFDQHMNTRRSLQWETLLNKFHQPQYTWNLESIVFIEDTSILSKLDDLLKKYQTKIASLLAGFSWVYIRKNLLIVTGKPMLCLTGDAEQLRQKFKRECLSHVQSFFGVVVSARHLYARYNDTVRKRLNSFFESVRDQVVAEIDAARWIEVSVKQKVITKVRDIGFNAMPEQSFFSKVALNSLYSSFSRLSGSFVRNYINVARAYRQVIGHENFVSIYSKRLVARAPSRYNYYYNIAFMSLGTLEPPFLYLDGTSAMQYGSLGTLIAQCMVRSFDRHGVLVNHRGVRDSWWGPSRAYDRVVDCDLGGTEHSSSNVSAGRHAALFPLAPALTASFDAYRKAVAKKTPDDQDELRLEGLEEYTDDQVFFMTYCLMSCANRGNGEVCNVPLRHTKRFATAFECPIGSPMNPEKKCLVFE
ncbi:hypothetical protein HPB48_025455 [Haemaphysalis longicornis]|uniref:Uncharacterized protein n=1 Tax=Haemaphysalis longicornis TaxID=44386 RepID=A0A9J6H9K3_HAELO|nr:hypothetical protein HPB48_025455 [Haemaphysalis longicornis]